MIGALVLAAGQSRRMGTQKLLLPLGGEPIITRIVDELLRAGLEHITVVVGRDAGSVEAALHGRRVNFARNLEAASDMLGSIRCGLRALPAECAGVLVALGDQPGLRAGLVAELIRVFREEAAGIAVPKYGGHRGHPVLFAAKFREEVFSQHDGVGLRGLLTAHPALVHELPVSAEAALEDMDTPADYERQQQCNRG